TLAEADQMIEAARARGQVLMVAENFHYMPAFRRVRALVAGGRLGNLRDLLLTSRGFRERTGWRLDPEAAGGGCLIDGGIHYLHNLRSWGGEVRRVFGLAPPPTLARLAGEDAVSALLELDRGVVGFLANSVATPGIPAFQWASVSGTRGTCFADNRGRLVVVRGGGGSSIRAYWRDHRGHDAMLRAFLPAITTGLATETDGGEGRRARGGWRRPPQRRSSVAARASSRGPSNPRRRPGPRPASGRRRKFSRRNRPRRRRHPPRLPPARRLAPWPTVGRPTAAFPSRSASRSTRTSATPT